MKTIKIKDVEISVEELQRVIKDNPDLLKPEVKGRYFFPKVGEMYWSINSYGLIFNNKNYDYDIDKHFISIGNCYRTKEEAELALKKQQAIVRCWKWQQENAPFEPDWGDEGQGKDYVYYGITNKKLRCSGSSYGRYQFTLPYFKSEEDCEAFREANKEDLLLLFTK